MIKVSNVVLSPHPPRGERAHSAGGNGSNSIGCEYKAWFYLEVKAVTYGHEIQCSSIMCPEIYSTIRTPNGLGHRPFDESLVRLPKYYMVFIFLGRKEELHSLLTLQ